MALLRGALLLLGDSLGRAVRRGPAILHGTAPHLAASTHGAATAADFLEANADEFQCFNALVARSGLAGALTADLPNTYFLPSDAAFITDLGVRGQGGAAPAR